MPKFFSMSFMMFMIIYIYTTVRDTKVRVCMFKV